MTSVNKRRHKQNYQLSDTREKNENFGSSLLLANSPMSPKIVNGSFAAIYDTADVFEECTKAFGQLRLEARDSPGKYLEKKKNGKVEDSKWNSYS